MDIAEQLHSNTSTPLANKITYLTRLLARSPLAPIGSSLPLLKHLCKLVINQRARVSRSLKSHGSERYRNKGSRGTGIASQLRESRAHRVTGGLRPLLFFPFENSLDGEHFKIYNFLFFFFLLLHNLFGTKH